MTVYIVRAGVEDIAVPGDVINVRRTLDDAKADVLAGTYRTTRGLYSCGRQFEEWEVK